MAKAKVHKLLKSGQERNEEERKMEEEKHL
jgi:hypothetical protein